MEGSPKKRVKIGSEQKKSAMDLSVCKNNIGDETQIKLELMLAIISGREKLALEILNHPYNNIEKVNQ